MARNQIQIAVAIASLGSKDADMALKYLILHQNSLQRSFEFHILSDFEDEVIASLSHGQIIMRSEVEKSMPAFMRRFHQSIQGLAEEFGLQSPSDLPIVILSTAAFSDNYYVTGDSNWAIVALGNWRASMSPPSITEFFLAMLLEASVDFACGDNYPSRHVTTKGCLFDFNANLCDARYSVLSGFICADCDDVISKSCSAQVASDVKSLLKKSWLGTVEKPSDAAITAKKLGHDLFHTKGVTPTWWEQTKMTIEQEAVKSMLKIISLIIGAALLAYFGLKIQD